MDPVDIVHVLSGHCPCSQWTLSMVSVDIVHGHNPWTQWTLSMDSRSNTPARQCPLSPWTFYRRGVCYVPSLYWPSLLICDEFVMCRVDQIPLK